MANTVVFGEKERTLRYDITAMLALEDAHGGKSTGEILAGLATWNLTSFILVLWAGLRHEDKTLTVPLTRKMLERYVTQEGANIRTLRNDVTEAIRGSQWFQQIQPDEDDEPTPAVDAEGNA